MPCNVPRFEIPYSGTDPASRPPFPLPQAENDLERSEWIDALTGVINCLLNGSVSVAAMPRVPVRPTHSRHTSFTADKLDTEGSLYGGSNSGTPYGTPDGSVHGDEGGPVGGGRGSVDGTGQFAPHGSSPSFSGGAGSGYSRLNPGRSSAAPATLERLRRVAGNRHCADCGAADPDWASLNLGVLLCIECSGVHRQLGVHISKVRSCTLDVKVWEPHVLELFEGIGNEASNVVWEAHLAERATRKGDAWVWCDDSDEDGSSTATAGGGGPGGGIGAGDGVSPGSWRLQRSKSGSSSAAAAAAAAAVAVTSPSGAGSGNLDAKQRGGKHQQVGH